MSDSCYGLSDESKNEAAGVPCVPTIREPADCPDGCVELDAFQRQQ